jgi:glycosyltransferase involved in cell wall biosynthesis
LPHLLEAGVCVHPSYGEGCSYAAGEALACGAPLIASENTGMNESIGDSDQLHIVPTGDSIALSEAIDAAYRGQLKATDAPPNSEGKPGPDDPSAHSHATPAEEPRAAHRL